MPKNAVLTLILTAIITMPLSAKSADKNNVNMAPSLTDYVSDSESPSEPQAQEDQATDPKQQPEQAEGQDGEKTWINTLVNKVAEKGAKIINPNMQDELANKKRSNASVFDVSGVMLRMNTKQADEALQNRGYKKTAEKFEIPNFIRWRFNTKTTTTSAHRKVLNCFIPATSPATKFIAFNIIPRRQTSRVTVPKRTICAT